MGRAHPTKAMKDDLHDRPAEGRAPKSQTVAHGRGHRATPRRSGKQVEIAIDGNPIEVPLGTTILEAAQQLGIRIPTLCYHEDLCLAGVCRDLRGGDGGPADAPGGVQLPDHGADPGQHAIRPRSAAPGGTSST